MRISRIGLTHSLDLAIVVAMLIAVLLTPVAFLVPFADEWSRVNYMNDHSTWELMVMHSLTWVVRPTAELIMGLATHPYTRPALAGNFTAVAFLRTFRRMYFALAFSYCALLALNAVVLKGRWLAREQTTLVALGVLTCWLTSEELGCGFYWIDGYGNVLIPFALLTSGLLLLARSRKLVPLAGAAVLIVLAALGHEVMCIYALGVLGLRTALRRPRSDGWARWGVGAGLLLVCGAVLWAQLFSEGPRIRGGHYANVSGSRYHFDIALESVLQIDPLRALLAVLTPILGVAIYRDHLAGLPRHAAADFARNRLFWVLLAAGTLLTCCLPLASVGLTKGRSNISAAYSTLTHLLFVVLGFVLCPILDRLSEPLLRGYRRHIGTVLPVLLVLWVTSNNRESFERAVVQHAELKAQARAYMTKLFDADKRAYVCRPDHPYVKKARGSTDRGEAAYFHLERVRHRCP